MSESIDIQLAPIDYVCGGRTGDLIHALYVIYAEYRKSGRKGNLWLTDDRSHGGDVFLKGAGQLLNEIGDILQSQEYINTCSHLKDNFSKPFINLNSWRFTNRSNWIDMLSTQYKVPIYHEPWLKINNINPVFENQILINRSLLRHINNFPWREITLNNQCIFITCDRSQFERFPYKNNVKLCMVNNFDDLMIAINSCKFFIGNQSSPMACAYALHIPCLVELEDEIYYKDLTKYHSKYFWITNTVKSIAGIETYLKF